MLPNSGKAWRKLPAQTDASSVTIPNSVTPRMPVRANRISSPIASAIGTVIAMVKSPHGLSASAFTTTSASTASRITMIASTLTSATKPTPAPISSFTIWPSDLPSRRIEANIVIAS